MNSFFPGIILAIMSIIVYASMLLTLSTQNHLALLRWAAVGMAIMGFIGAMILPLNVSIWVWWSVTGSIYGGGAGAILIGGLYWRKGTVQAAWATMIVSGVLGLSCVVITNNWLGTHTALVKLGCPEILISGFIPGFLVMLISIILYVVVSLVTCKKTFDLDRLLSRAQEHKESEILKVHKKPLLHRILGIDEHFTRGDRWIAMLVFFYSLSMSFLVAVMVFWQYAMPWLLKQFGHPELIQTISMTKHAWINLWLVVGLLIPGFISVVTLFWFSFGSYFDLRRFFVDSANRNREDDDNGMVKKDAEH